MYKLAAIIKTVSERYDRKPFLRWFSPKSALYLLSVKITAKTPAAAKAQPKKVIFLKVGSLDKFFRSVTKYPRSIEAKSIKSHIFGELNGS